MDMPHVLSFPSPTPEAMPGTSKLVEDPDKFLLEGTYLFIDIVAQGIALNVTEKLILATNGLQRLALPPETGTVLTYGMVDHSRHAEKERALNTTLNSHFLARWPWYKLGA